MQIVVNNLLTTYEIAGSGKTILILPGWGESIRDFSSLSNELSKQFKVIRLDLAGFGSSEAPKTAWGLNEYADYINEFLNKTKQNNLYAVIGHSNGGAIAIRGLSLGRLKAEKLVLLASAGIRTTYKGRKKVLRIIAKTGKLITLPLPKSAKKSLRKKVYKTIGSDMLVVEHMQETFKKVVTDDVQADAKKLDLPVLLIYGDQDDQAPLTYGKAFHEQISDSTLEIIENGDHFIHLNQPDKVNKLVMDFLK